MARLNETIRVIHLPARTPYARLITSPNILILNDKSFPRDLSFEWLYININNIIKDFDILHIHSIELAPIDKIKDVCQKLIENKKGIIFTIHDTAPMFSKDKNSFYDIHNFLNTCGVKFVTLTNSAKSDICAQTFLKEEDIRLIPHGNVLDFNSPLWNKEKSKSDDVIFSMHGGFRENKNYLSVIINFEFGLPENTKLNFLTRGISDIEFRSNSDIEKILYLASVQKKIQLQIMPHPTDDQVVSFTDNSDAIVMPYKWGSHSGQLELAFDLGLKSIITDVGFYYDQYQNCKNIAFEPELVNWSDGLNYQYGNRMLGALLNTYNKRDEKPLISRKEIKEFRLTERKYILDKYFELYQASIL